MLLSALTPLIDADYVLLDCPCHFNTGDLLIWEGERALLSQLPHKCLGQWSMYTFRDGIAIPPSAVILLHGGGNFGNLWKGHQRFRRRIAEKYPDNRIVILPQTVWYTDEAVMKSDAGALGRHPDLTICARDTRSYAILRENFSNPVLLLPDSAFCIPLPELRRYGAGQREGTLFIERRDKEVAAVPRPFAAGERIDVRDWPGKGGYGIPGLVMRMLRGATIVLGRCCRRSWAFGCVGRLLDGFVASSFLPRVVKKGIRMVSPYEKVISSRLHGAILALLLGKKCTLLDNSYGKNAAFYRSWLSDADDIDYIF